jgi:hypothetical protein
MHEPPLGRRYSGLGGGATGDPSASGYSIPGGRRAEFRRLTIADAFDRGFIALTSTSCIGASPSASTSSYSEERSERCDLSVEQVSKYDPVINLETATALDLELPPALVPPTMRWPITSTSALPGRC